MSSSSTPRYLSSPSANALISDLRPTSLSPLALSYINTLLDEILCALISAAGSINPIHLRLQGVPSVFTSERGAGESTGPRALGRAAVSEAEVELRSWYEGRPMAKGSIVGFPPDGKGRGLIAERERLNARFPMEAGIELLRLKTATFCTLAPQTPPSKAWEEQATASWKNAGGDLSDETVAPAGLWLTAVIEHVCEHILSQLSRVVARDSSITVASVENLYTALCEDESIYGMFKRMRIRESLENAVRAGERTKRGAPQRSGISSQRLNLGSSSNSPRDSKASFDTTPDFSPSRKSTVPSLDGRTSMESFRPSPSSLKGKHERTSSVLSNTTSRILTAFQDEESGRSVRNSSDKVRATLEDEEDFDALIRSGETMKVSLTPSRLKTFETASPRPISHSVSPEVSRTPRSVSATAQQAAIMPQHPPVPEPQQEELSPLLPTSVLPSTSDLMNRGIPSSTTGSAVPVPVGQQQSGSRSPPNRARSSNSLKLIPRGATIEERDEDENGSHKKGGSAFSAGAGQGGQSLMELLKSEIQDERAKKKGAIRSSSQSVQRTVPALIVGSPPPPAKVEETTSLLQVPASNGKAPKSSTTDVSSTCVPPSSFNSPTGAAVATSAFGEDRQGSTQPLHINRAKTSRSPASQSSSLPGATSTDSSLKKTKSVNCDITNDANDLDEDLAADALGNLKPRSAARELADFLNTTPPPEPAPPRFSDDSSSIPEQPRKGSFKSLMSKVTGGSSNRKGNGSSKEESSPPVPAPSKNVARFDDSPTVRTHMLDKQNSPSGPSPRSAITLKGVLRKPSAPVDPSLPQDKLPLSVSRPTGTAAVVGIAGVATNRSSSDKDGNGSTGSFPSTAAATTTTNKSTVPPQGQTVNASPRMSPTVTTSLNISEYTEQPSTLPTISMTNMTSKQSANTSITGTATVPASSKALTPAVPAPTPVPASAPNSAGGNPTGNGLSDVVRPRDMQIQDEHIGPNTKFYPPMPNHPLEISPHSQAPTMMPVALPVPTSDFESYSVPQIKSQPQPQAQVQLSNQNVPPQSQAAVTTAIGSRAVEEAPALASDDHSFKTADEGDESMAAVKNENLSSKDLTPLKTTKPKGDDTNESDSATPQPPASQATFPGPSSTIASKPLPTASSSAPSSIALTELIPLRNLLEHATSARECRLLLNAILTQWGVPNSTAARDGSFSGPDGEPRPLSMPTPEDRVTAWLLAGREGPVGDFVGLGVHGGIEALSNGSNNSRLSRDDEQVITPIQRVPGLPEGHHNQPLQQQEQHVMTANEIRNEDLRQRATRLFSVGALGSKTPEFDQESGAFGNESRMLGSADILSQVDEVDEEGTVITGPMIPTPQSGNTSRFGNGSVMMV